MPVKLNEREYRKIDIQDMEIRTTDDGEMIVEGYATTFNQPYRLMERGDFVLDEQVDRNAFAETDMRDVIMQYDHEGRVFARMRNNTLQVEPDDHGLKIRAYLGGTEIGRQLYEEIAGGYTDRMSFAFTVAEDDRANSKMEDGRTRILRTITRIGKLFDVSAVSLPANDATEISARSVGDGLITEALEEIKAEEERAAQAQAEIERRSAAIERLNKLIEEVK